ncbi:hypothetical protein BCV70DRAFT_161353 [Testicularia cyperi]|uniref:Large ribosomal subunit protein mL43 n=1 Tax=Testicularia cyperi TaxID=1882483 RepID=A0A317XRY1_9BASI|nr:hypothetical protein BCV70DRAFT_161353 [Testicularia cyperi]
MSYLKNFAKVMRGSLSTTPGGVSGTPGSFHLPIRKLILRYSEQNASSTGTRQFLLSSEFAALTQKYPSVEFVVSAAPRDKHPLVTGFYNSHRDASKQINLANLDKNQVEAKIRQIIDSSGSRIKSLKRRPTLSRNDSPRGIWSQLHDKPVDI